MVQLQKNQFENVCWIIAGFIITIVLIFPGCATKKDQNIQDTGITNTQETKANSETNTLIDVKQHTNDEKIINAIKLLQKPTLVEVIIEGSKDLKYTSIKQSFPFGIAIYLPETRIDEKVVSIVSETGGISNVIPSYADKDKKTAKIEILLNEDLPYDIKRELDNLKVTIPNVNKIVKSDNFIKDNKGPNTKVVQIPKGIANVADIEFTVEDEGYTELKLTTSHPIRYDFSKGNKGVLYLNLYKTTIPHRHRRPFETKYFKSAVYKILPIQKSKNTKNSKIEISMREKVPYQVAQDNNTITLRFEPSSIEPPKFTKADKTIPIKATNDITDKPSRLEVNTQTTDNVEINNTASIVNNSIKSSNPLLLSQKSTPQAKVTPAIESLSQQSQTTNTSNQKTKIYTGEKIKLDFFETDIKNVFRILSSISNTNFAIDKDVTGSVTLTLDKPIPWDQVLDLVLSMNQLGQIQEGGVRRIATQETLQNEAQQEHKKFEAMRKAKEEKKALEPLFTEYIPVNYAKAKENILPHLEKIITEDRGTVSIDERTNMVIITDTQAKIKTAKHLIYTLDNVTPQIMIKAKVVEARKEFSRSLGIGAQFGYDENTANHAFDLYNMSLNTLSSGTSSGSFSFNNLLGKAIGGAGGTSYLNVTLAAAETNDDIKILSSPKVLTLDNIEAQIKQGLTVPYVTIQDGKIKVKFVEIDLLLKVTPHVTPDQRISLDIYVTKNEISGWLEGVNVPVVATNEAKTTLLVNNNDTIVIGGVIKSKETLEKDGLPFLMNIPLLGRLFRTDAKETNKEELLIFITPTIVQLEQKRLDTY